MFLCAAPLVAATAHASTGLIGPRGAARGAPPAARTRLAPARVVRCRCRSRPRPRRRRGRRVGSDRPLGRAGPRACSWGSGRTPTSPASPRELRAARRRAGAFATHRRARGHASRRGAALVAALRGDPRVAYIERDRDAAGGGRPLRRARPRNRHQVHLGLRRRARRRGARRGGRRLGAAPSSVIDTGLDVTHPEFAGQIARTLDAGLRRHRRDRLRGARHLRLRPDRRASTATASAARAWRATRKVVAVRASTDGCFSVVGPGARHRVRDPERRRRAQHEPRRRGLHRSQARALEAAFFNDVLPVAASGNNAQPRQPARVPRRGDRRAARRARHRPLGRGHDAGRRRGAVLEPQRLREPRRARRERGSCEFGVFSTLPASHRPAWDEGGCPRALHADAAPASPMARARASRRRSRPASRRSSGRWSARLASEQVADVLTARRGNWRAGWNEFTGTGIVDGARRERPPAVYDVPRPRARGTARRAATA